MLCKLLFNCREYNTLAWAGFTCSVPDDGSNVSVHCVCAVWIPGRWQHSPVGCEQRCTAGCVADLLEVHGELSRLMAGAGVVPSAASSILGCRVVPGP
jgi:hypothetical protein